MDNSSNETCLLNFRVIFLVTFVWILFNETYIKIWIELLLYVDFVTVLFIGADHVVTRYRTTQLSIFQKVGHYS